MSFDRTNPADLATLKTEVNTDPIGMGYNPDNTQQVIKPINDPDSNVGGETQSRPFNVSAMLDALVPADYDAQQTATDAATYVHTLVEYGAYGDIAPYKTKFRDLFAANSDTVAALDAQISPLSRAEVLFGIGTIITRDDWIAARDS